MKIINSRFESKIRFFGLFSIHHCLLLFPVTSLSCELRLTDRVQFIKSLHKSDVKSETNLWARSLKNVANCDVYSEWKNDPIFDNNFSAVQFSNNASPNFISESTILMFRLSFEVSFITEFYLEGCQNSQKVKVVLRLFAYKQILLSNIWLKFDFFHCFF